MGVCILALVIQHAMRMRRIILSHVACQALPYFSTLSHKRRDFRGGGGGEILPNIKCAFRFYPQLLRETFLNLRIIQRETIINVQRSSSEVPVILVRF